MIRHTIGQDAPPYPHEGACEACRALRVCNACGAEAPARIRCTNGRCAKCHANVCTPGGATSAGHGFGLVRDGERWKVRERAKR